MTKYVLDTNIFVQADRDRAWAEELAAFYAAFLPVTFLHAVVVQELLLGAVNVARGHALYDGYVAPFEARGRVLTPSYGSWRRSGEVVATLVQRRRLSPGSFSRSFLNDVLLAVSCRQAGVVLITTNTADFTRIRAVEPLRFVAPWPHLAQRPPDPQMAIGPPPASGSRARGPGGPAAPRPSSRSTPDSPA